MAHDALRDSFFEQMEKELARLIDSKTGKVRDSLLERTPCPLCRSSSHTPLFVKNGLDFVRCEPCGFVYVNPRLKQALIEEGYTGDEEAESNRIWKDVLLSPAQQEFNNEAYAILLDQLGTRVPTGRLLDVGCSVGHFMDLAQKRGYEVEGIEIEREALAHARESGFVVHDKKLEELNLPDASYSAVALLGLVEHIPHPVSFMKEVNRILIPGGAVIINGLPNVESAVVMALREEARMFNGRNHLGYYSPRTLSALFKSTGFSTEFCETYVTGLDSILNKGQFLNPFGQLETRFLTEKLRALSIERRAVLEDAILGLDLGYKIRAIGIKK